MSVAGSELSVGSLFQRGSSSFVGCTLFASDTTLYDHDEGGLRSACKPAPSAVPRQHHCQFCVKSFPSPKDLRRHVMTHTGEKPHVCPHCPYRTALKGNLKVHVLGVHQKKEAHQ